MEELNVVDATQDQVVVDQIDDSTVNVDNENSEVVTATTEGKPVQSPEENSKYAEVRRKAAQEAEDKVYRDLYGAEYGINSKADYERAMAEQREQELLESLKEEDVDPKSIFDELKKNDPDYLELQRIKQENYTNNQIAELNNDLKDLEIDIKINSLDDLVKLNNIDNIMDQIKKGKTLSEAYFLANKKEIISKKAQSVQNETIKKLQANGDATPGSLANNGDSTVLFSREQVDAMSQAEVNKNYELIMKSMKTWK